MKLYMVETKRRATGRVVWEPALADSPAEAREVVHQGAKRYGYGVPTDTADGRTFGRVRLMKKSDLRTLTNCFPWGDEKQDLDTVEWWEKLEETSR